MAAQWPGQVATEAPPPAPASPGLRLVVPPSASIPTPQNPNQAEATDVGTARTRQQITQDDTRGVNFADEETLRTHFLARPEVQNYPVVLPMFAAATRAADNPVGDMQIITAWAKTYDPIGSVREGDVAAAEQAQSRIDAIRAEQSNWDGRGRLLPHVRRNFLMEMRNRAASLGQAYNQSRQQYEQNAQRYGFDPNAIVGPHPAIPFRDEEEAFMGRVVGDVPVDTPMRRAEAGRAPDGTHLAFWDDAERPTPPGGEQFATDLEAALRAGTFRSPEQIIAYGANYRSPDGTPRHFDISQEQAVAAIEAMRTGSGIGVSRPTFEAPDIEGRLGIGGSGETVGAAARGAGDALTAGLATPAAAAMDTFGPGGSGTFGENLYRQQGIDQYDEENHAIARTAGQLIGGALIPTSAVTAARTAAVGAIRAGAGRAEALAAARAAAGRRLGAEGAVYGAVHGGASSQGDVSDHIANAVVESALSGIGGTVIGRYSPGPAARVRGGDPALPPLVDPVTGRMNAPLEEANAAQRMAAAADQGIELPLGAATDRGGAIMEKGLDVSPITAGLMNDRRRVVSDQATAAVENVAGRYGGARTMDEAGTALQTGARNWIQRATVAARDGAPSVVSRAYNAIPISPQAEAVLTNTRAALDRLTSRFQSNPELAALEQNQTLVRYRDALASGGLSWEDQKALRSEIGNRIGAERFSESPSRGDLRALYAAMSEDMRATATAQGPRALRAFERANDLNRNVENRIEGALVRLLGDDSANNPERAAAALQTISRSGRGSGNLRQLAEIRSSLQKGQEWDDVAGALIRLGGQPANAEGRQFNPQTFVDWYAGMTEPARNLLFSGGGGRAELRQNLDDFTAVAQRLAGTNALRNTSNTTPGLIGAGAMAGIVPTLWAGLMSPLAAAGTAGTMGLNYGVGKAWTNPRFVRWATGFGRMLNGAGRAGAAPTAENMSRQRQYLMRVGRATPSIAAEIADLDQRLFGEGAPENGPRNQ